MNEMRSDEMKFRHQMTVELNKVKSMLDEVRRHQLIDMNPYFKLDREPRNQEHRGDMVQVFYPSDGNKKIKVTCFFTPAEGTDVIAAHILPFCSCSNVLHQLGWQRSDLDKAKNCLFMTTNMEKAFDSLQLSIVAEQRDNEELFVVKFFDPDAKNYKIFEGSPYTIYECVNGKKYKLNDKVSKRALAIQHFYANEKANPDSKLPMRSHVCHTWWLPFLGK